MTCHTCTILIVKNNNKKNNNAFQGTKENNNRVKACIVLYEYDVLLILVMVRIFISSL